MAEENYVYMLRESLEKKIEILQEIRKENELQKGVLEDPMSGPDDLKETVDRKDKLIDVINALDSGFAQMYERVKKILDQNGDDYRDEIKKMQDLISELTALSATVQAEEHRNKELATAKFAKVRSQIKSAPHTRTAMDSYYTNMSKLNVVDPQFVDRKN